MAGSCYMKVSKINSYAQVDCLHLDNGANPKARGSEKSGFSRILDIFNNKRNAEPRHHICGKACQLEQKTKTMSFSLQRLREEWESKGDRDASAALGVFLRDVKRVQAALQGGDVELAEKWTSKAAEWISLAQDDSTRQLLRKSLAEHLISQSMQQLERDMATISNYAKQHIGDQGKETDTKINQLIGPEIEKLRDLLSCPAEKSLKSVKKWKDALDLSRAAIFRTALENIERCPGS